MWVGLSTLTGKIPVCNQMRGIRLRKENIQIGDENALQKLFKEDRGNDYFVGEVFAVSGDLIPNSQRDYFNENSRRVAFDDALKEFFRDELHNLYNDASKINSAKKKIVAYEKALTDFKEKENKIGFEYDARRNEEREKIEVAKKAAEAAHKNIEKVKEKIAENPEGLMGKVIKRIETKNPPKPLPDTPPEKPSKPSKIKRRVDKLSHIPDKSRKLISRIYEIIHSATDSKTAEIIISKIEDDLSQ